MKYLSLLLATMSLSCFLAPDVSGKWSTDRASLEYTFFPSESADLETLSLRDVNIRAWEGELTLDGALTGTLTGPIDPVFSQDTLNLQLTEYTGEAGAEVTLVLVHPGAGSTYLEYKQGESLSVRFEGVLNQQSEPEDLQILETELTAEDGRVITIQGQFSAQDIPFSQQENVQENGLSLAAPDAFQPIIPESWDFQNDLGFTGKIQVPGQELEIQGNYTYVDGNLAITAAPEGFPEEVTWKYRVSQDGPILILSNEREISDSPQPEKSYLLETYSLDAATIDKIMAQQKIFLTK
jgi:hypothetical protein